MNSTVVLWSLFIGSVLWIALVSYEFIVVRKKMKLLDLALREANELINASKKDVGMY